MVRSIHRYKLKEDRPGEFIHPATQSNCIPLSRDGEITLQPEWGERQVSESEWHDDDFDFKYFIVLDESFCQPYMPFYRAMNGEAMKMTEYLTEVIDNYNKALDACPWLERIL